MVRGVVVMIIKTYDFKAVGERIKIAREHKGYTQYILAEKLDKAVQHISEIERGRSGVSMTTLIELCTLLEVDADYLLFGTISNNETNPINEKLKALTPQQRLQAENVLMAFINSCN